jgi:hypothetical protein
MKRCIRENFDIVKAMVSPHGLSVRLEHGGKHPAAVVTARDGGEHRVTIASSPLNEDHQKGNTRQTVMRLLESMGLDSGRGHGPEARKAGRRRQSRVRSTIHRVEVAIDPDTGPARDPWAALRDWGE